MNRCLSSLLLSRQWIAVSVLTLWAGSQLCFGSDVTQYWSLEDASGSTATNSVAGGNDGTLVNFAGTGWTNDTPSTLAYSTGSLDFNTASNQHVNGGHIGVSSTGLNKGASVSVWLKPKSLTADMRLWGQLNRNGSNGHPLGAISLGNNAYGWALQGFYPPGNTWVPIMPFNTYAIDVWQHFCFVWTEDQLVTYHNGNPVGGMDHTFEFDLDAGTAMQFGIGAKYLNSYGQSYDGMMDDLAVWDENLTAAQVHQLASGVSPLSIADRADVAAPPAPLAEYRLDGNAQDAGGSYSGTLLGDATFTNGVDNTPFSYEGNSALKLDGSGDSVRIADAAALRPGTNGWTMSLWFKTVNTNHQYGAFIAKRKGSSPYTQMALMMGGAGTGNPGDGQKIHTFVIGANLSGRWEITSSRTYADEEWHHLALVRTPDSWDPVLYVDGTATAIYINQRGGDRPHDINCTDPWYIGDTGANAYFEGLIDEVAMWDQALTGEQIAWLSQNSVSEITPVMPDKPLAEYRMDGNANDTRGRNPGSVTGDASFVNGVGDTPFSYSGNSALELDGTGDSVSIPDSAEIRPGTSSWTLSLWFKTTNDNQYGGLIAKRKNGTPYTQMSLMFGGAGVGNPGNGELIHTFVLGTQTSVDRWEVRSRRGYADDEWHHLALVRQSGDTSPVVYVDGAVSVVDILYDAGTRPHNINCTDPWLIGTEGSNYFEGLVDEVAMWDSALSASEIAWLAANSLSSIPRDGTIILIQ